MRKSVFFLFAMAAVLLLVSVVAPRQQAKHYLAQAQEGDVRAQVIVGEMYLTGESFSRDEAQAAEWFRWAASKGDAQAQTQLALLYASGVGVEEDLARAIVLLGKAAKQGHGQALDVLHWMSQAAH